MQDTCFLKRPSNIPLDRPGGRFLSLSRMGTLQAILRAKPERSWIVRLYRSICRHSCVRRRSFLPAPLCFLQPLADPCPRPANGDPRLLNRTTIANPMGTQASLWVSSARSPSPKMTEMCLDAL